MRYLTIILLLFSLTVFSETRTHKPWLPIPSPTSKTLNRLHFLDSLRGWVVGNEGIIIRTTDGGQSWVVQDSRVSAHLLDIFMVNDRIGWAVGIEYPAAHRGPWYGTTILNTTDGGNEWSNKSFGSEFEFFYAIHFLDSLRGWIGGDFGRLYGTTDGGNTWYRPSIDSSLFSGFTIFTIRFENPRIGFAIGGQRDIAGVIWHTTNYGAHWTVDGAGLEPLFGIEVLDSSIIHCVGGDFDFGSGIVRSSDAGETWEYEYLGIWGEARGLSYRTRSEAWAPLGFAGTVMFTLDSGRIWTEMYTPDTTAMYDVVFTDSLTGYMVGDEGRILKYVPLVANVRAIEDATGPSTFVLYQNYPNPFNPKTNIEFRIADFGFVSLKVYDLVGQEVATLVSEELNPGRYEVTWDAAHVASGMYIYRLDNGERTQSRKLLIVR